MADLPPTPLWVKVFGITALVLVLVFLTLHLTGNSPGGSAGHAPSVEGGVQQR